MKYTMLPALLICLLTATCTVLAADAKKGDDKKPKPVNTTCPLTDEKIDPAVTTQYKGKTVAFCCADCIKDFNKDPEKYMKKIEADNKKKDADKKKGEQPAADKGAAQGATVNKFCAVEKENAVDATVATTTYKGKTIGFCCEDCIKKFDVDPAAYVANLK